jgi:hypothetical protein
VAAASSRVRGDKTIIVISATATKTKRYHTFWLHFEPADVLLFRGALPSAVTPDLYLGQIAPAVTSQVVQLLYKVTERSWHNSIGPCHLISLHCRAYRLEAVSKLRVRDVSDGRLWAETNHSARQA